MACSKNGRSTAPKGRKAAGSKACKCSKRKSAKKTNSSKKGKCPCQQ